MFERFQMIEKGEKIGPKLLMLSPTDFCNLNCKICWRIGKKPNFKQPPFHFFKKILREAKELKVETIDLTGGGEPFLRKDILDIMDLVKKFGMRGTITTNSTLIKKSDVKKVVEMKWDEINFSLDGSTSEINDYIRGEGIFEKVLKVVKRFEEEKNSKNVQIPILRFCFTITKKNFMDIPNFIKLSKSLDIRHINFSTLFEWRSNKEFWLDKKDEKDVMKKIKEGVELSKKLGIKTNLDSILEFGVWEHQPPRFCFAPWYMLFINASEEAMVCCTLASLYKKKLGKINSLKEIWFCRKIEELRKRMKRRVLFKECNKCLPEFTHIFNQLWDEIWNSKK
ncbi:MAG: radical SAM protein [Candidatus Aenigmatarchaeota archaeon]